MADSPWPDRFTRPSRNLFSRFRDISISSSSSSSGSTNSNRFTRSTGVSSITSSTRLEQSYHNVTHDPLTNLRELIKTLKENDVPGPQLFRLKNEFTYQLGFGGQSEVRGFDQNALENLKKLRAADRKARWRWPVELIAIKQHKPVTDDTGRSRLGSHFLAAQREILALAPTLFQNHPNIVQLLGWGFCLDAIEESRPDSLQIPLLILERADMDMLQFLQRDVHTKKYRMVGNWYGFLPYPEEDVEAGRLNLYQPPIKIVRQLCIDIGNGLKALHDADFSHGDLKPKNVLVFKTGTGWVGKLCDFGCARGVIAPSKTGIEAQLLPQYSGTAGWFPPEGADRKGEGITHENLPKCDVYAYGLVIWSAFCKAGEPPILIFPERKSDFGPWILEQAVRDIQEMLKHMPQFADCLTAVLRDCLQIEPSDRPLTPWVRLSTPERNFSARLEAWVSNQYSKAFLAANKQKQADPVESEESGGYGIDSSSAPSRLQPANTMESDRSRDNVIDSSSSLSKVQQPADAAESEMSGENGIGLSSPASKLHPALSPEAKKLYESKTWWSCNSNADANSTLNSNPASSEPLRDDDDFRSLSTFREPRSPAEICQLYSDLDCYFQENQIDEQDGLYCCARFRSRLPLSSLPSDHTETNFVQKALEAIPAIEISTLAWLCRGELGIREVRGLNSEYTTWKVILDSSFLNESERLERFLLLLQFGAPIEKELSGSPSPSQIPMNQSVLVQSIIVHYILNSRRIIVSTISAEIFSRFERVKNETYISKNTRLYLSSRRTDKFTVPGHSSSQAWKDILLAMEYTRKQNESSISETFVAQDANQPLVPLPLGWEEVAEVAVGPETIKCFRELLTGSITLQKPTCSLLTISQIPLGYGSGNKGTCYVDISSFIRPEMSRAARKTFDREFGGRFHFYNDSWFRMEPLGTGRTDDVFLSIKTKEPFKFPTWELPSFADRIRVPSVIGDILRNHPNLVWEVLGVLLIGAAVIGLAFVLLPLVIYTILLCLCAIPLMVFLMIIQYDPSKEVFRLLMAIGPIPCALWACIHVLMLLCPGTTWDNWDDAEKKCVKCAIVLWTYGCGNGK